MPVIVSMSVAVGNARENVLFHRTELINYKNQK
jgi:hypothetical protein